MATWKSENSMLTARGIEILNKVKAGIGSITITKIVAGSNRVPESRLYSMTQVSGTTKTLIITHEGYVENGSEISCYLTNAGFTENFELNQIGVFVSHPDYVEEQLYHISQCDEESPDIIPPFEDTPVTFGYSLFLEHANSSSITINVNPQSSTPYGLVDRHINAISESDFDSRLDLILEEMPPLSVKLVTVSFSSAHTVLGSTPKVLRIDKLSDTSATIQVVGHPTNAQEIVCEYFRAKSNGVWADWVRTYNTKFKPTPAEIGAALADYGLGESYGKPCTNLNMALEGGFYEYAKPSANKPTSSPGVVLVLPGNLGTVQIAVDSPGGIYLRRYDYSKWSAWSIASTKVVASTIDMETVTISANLPCPPTPGQELIFTASLDCDKSLQGLRLSYPDDNGATVVKFYTFVDAHNNPLSNVKAFVQGSLVQVLLDTSGKAYVLNATTNSHLEDRLPDLANTHVWKKYTGEPGGIAHLPVSSVTLAWRDPSSSFLKGGEVTYGTQVVITSEGKIGVSSPTTVCTFSSSSSDVSALLGKYVVATGASATTEEIDGIYYIPDDATLTPSTRSLIGKNVFRVAISEQVGYATGYPEAYPQNGKHSDNYWYVYHKHICE